MTPREYQALTEFVRETLARAQVAVRRSAEIQATAAELTIIAEDLCSRAGAERERAQELARERLRRSSAAVRDSRPTPGLPPCLRTPTRFSGRAGRQS
jgi:hypothetical protein